LEEVWIRKPERKRTIIAPIMIPGSEVISIFVDFKK